MGREVSGESEMAINTFTEETQDIPRFDYRSFAAKYPEATVAHYADRQTVYVQGDAAAALYYIVSGTAKLSVLSEQGKEGVIAILKAGDFFGEACLDGNLLRNSTITATSACEIARFDRGTIVRALSEDTEFSRYLLNVVLQRNRKLQADIVDHLFNSSEQRLARILLTLATSGLSESSNEITIPLTQEMLANMVGTTRSRISQFMTKFRKLGYIDYNGRISVRHSLLNIILNEQNGD
jgi:CRP/FNR family transcriptional regulator, cyclic AMP receptor protein